MADISKMAARSGRQLKEDSTAINTAEMIEAIYNALVVNKDAGVEVDGMGQVDTVAVTDPDAETANQLSLLRGLLKQLQTKVVAELSGRIPEYAWLDGAEAPTPTESFAWGYKFNSSTGAVTAYGWTGAAWTEVL